MTSPCKTSRSSSGPQHGGSLLIFLPALAQGQRCSLWTARRVPWAFSTCCCTAKAKPTPKSQARHDSQPPAPFTPSGSNKTAACLQAGGPEAGWAHTCNELGEPQPYRALQWSLDRHKAARGSVISASRHLARWGPALVGMTQAFPTDLALGGSYTPANRNPAGLAVPGGDGLRTTRPHCM